ncbi:MAG: hypothetical protein Q7T76_21595 [Ferruginibacter sp.]|nr:hypothetical protein [Ferruginibacter sp.]
MKKFLFHIGCFVLPLLVLAYPADLVLSKYLKQSHPYSDEYSVWNAIYEGKLNAEILVYGSSTAWVQVNPQSIADSLHRRVYNLGMDGHNFQLQYLRHKQVLKYNPPPKLIIQTLDALTLQRRPDLFNQDQFLPYMLFNKDLKNATANYKGYKPVDFQVPLVRYYGKQKAIRTAAELTLPTIGEPPVRVLGFQAQNKVWNNDLSAARNLMEKYTVQMDSASIQLFDHYLQECREKHLQLVFHYSPEFIVGQRFISNREDVIALYEKFSRKYGIPFYNYSTDPLTRDRDNYYNGLHLNKQGASKLTSKLIHDLQQEVSLNRCFN